MSQIFTCVTSFSSEALLQLLRRQQPGPRARHQVVQPAQEEVQRAQGLGGGGGRGAAQEEALLQQISGKAGEGHSLPEIEIGGNFKLHCFSALCRGSRGGTAAATLPTCGASAKWAGKQLIEGSRLEKKFRLM